MLKQGFNFHLRLNKLISYIILLNMLGFELWLLANDIIQSIFQYIQYLDQCYNEVVHQPVQSFSQQVEL